MTSCFQTVATDMTKGGTAMCRPFNMKLICYLKTIMYTIWNAIIIREITT